MSISQKKETGERLYNASFSVISLIGLLCFGSVLVLLLLFENSDYPVHVHAYASNKVLIIPALVIPAIYCLLPEKRKSNYSLSSDIIVKRALPFLFLLQIYIFRHLFFESGWDALVSAVTARAIANGDKAEVARLSAEYYSRYQNNMLLALIYGALLKINNAVGVFSSEYGMMTVVTVNSAVSLISAYLVYRILRILFPNRHSLPIFGLLLSLLLFSFSPWNVITYSDSFCIIIPAFIFYLYINREMNYFFRWIMLFVAGYIGFLIKPASAIILIAIIIIKALLIMKTGFNDRQTWLKRLKAAGASLIVILLVAGILDYSYKLVGFEIDNDKKFGTYHWLMVGQNSPTNGVYLEEDVGFAKSFHSFKARQEAEKQEAIRRIADRGLYGETVFTAKKVLCDYNDGTFAWGVEGNFYFDIRPELTSASGFLRDLFYSYGPNYRLFKNMTQILWLMTLLLIFISIIAEIYKTVKEKSHDSIFITVLTALIGASIYDAIFETRARYLYIFVPLYIVCAVYGIEFLGKQIKNIKRPENHT